MYTVPEISLTFIGFSYFLSNVQIGVREAMGACFQWENIPSPDWYIHVHVSKEIAKCLIIKLNKLQNVEAS